MSGPGRRDLPVSERRVGPRSRAYTLVDNNGDVVAAGSSARQSADAGFVKEVVMFEHIWTSEQEVGVSCSLCCRKVSAIWQFHDLLVKYHLVTVFDDVLLLCSQIF